MGGEWGEGMRVGERPRKPRMPLPPAPTPSMDAAGDLYTPFAIMAGRMVDVAFS